MKQGSCVSLCVHTDTYPYMHTVTYTLSTYMHTFQTNICQRDISFIERKQFMLKLSIKVQPYTNSFSFEYISMNLTLWTCEVYLKPKFLLSFVGKGEFLMLLFVVQYVPLTWKRMREFLFLLMQETALMMVMKIIIIFTSW